MSFVGEGERIWPAAVQAVAEGSTQRVWDAADFPPIDIRSLPDPALRLAGRRAPTPASRCRPRGAVPGGATSAPPTSCSMSRIANARSPTSSATSMPSAKLQKRPFIEFADDNTFVDHAWGKDLCRALIPLGVKWFTETDISVADDPELLRLMRQARCRQVLIGLESPERRAPWKGSSSARISRAAAPAPYVEAVRRIQAAGITVNGCFILGLDRQTPAIFEQSSRLRLGRAAVRRADHGAHALSGDAAVRPPAPAKAAFSPRAGGTSVRLFDVNFVPRNMTRRATAGGRVLAGGAAVQRGELAAPAASVFRRPVAATGAGGGSAARTICGACGSTCLAPAVAPGAARAPTAAGCRGLWSGRRMPWPSPA